MLVLVALLFGVDALRIAQVSKKADALKISEVSNQTRKASQPSMGDIFKMGDADASGFLDTSEVRQLMMKMNPPGTPAMDDDMLKGVIKQIDMDGDGRINFEEFKAAMSQQKDKSPEEYRKEYGCLQSQGYQRVVGECQQKCNGWVGAEMFWVGQRTDEFKNCFCKTCPQNQIKFLSYDEKILGCPVDPNTEKNKDGNDFSTYNINRDEWRCKDQCMESGAWTYTMDTLQLSVSGGMDVKGCTCYMCEKMTPTTTTTPTSTTTLPFGPQSGGAGLGSTGFISKMCGKDKLTYNGHLPSWASIGGMELWCFGINLLHK